MEMTEEMAEELSNNRDEQGEDFWEVWSNDGIEAGVQDDSKPE